MAQSAPLSSNTVMAVVPDSNRIPFYIYSANNFSNRIFYIGLFDFPRRRRPQKAQSLSAPDRSRILIIASANANCKGECIFCLMKFQNPSAAQKSVLPAKTPIGGFENRAFPSRPAVIGPAAPAARRFFARPRIRKNRRLQHCVGFCAKAAQKRKRPQAQPCSRRPHS